MTTRPDRTIPFAFVDDLDAPALDDDERHHLERVRRLRPRDSLTVGDGRGRFRVVRFGPGLAADGPIEQVSRAVPSITVAFALTKSDKPELVVQKLTELDVDRIVPFVAARTVVRWDGAKAARNVERWRTIAREAAAQAHRPWLPEISDVGTFAQVMATDGATVADPDGGPPTLERPTVLVGPEGGWAPEELAAAPHRTRLPGNVLRAETAAVVAGALLVALRAG
jgi:16S rRNA (uracil1498-N3)-methyltransferase